MCLIKKKKKETLEFIMLRAGPGNQFDKNLTQLDINFKKRNTKPRRLLN